MSRNYFLNSRNKGKILDLKAWHGYQVIIWEWVLVFIAFIMVAVRVFVQIWYRNRPYRELLTVLAWIMFLVNAICDSIMNSYNWLNLDVGHFNRLKPEEKAYILKLNYLESFMYKPSIYLCKAALLCFFTELCSKQFYAKTYRLILVAWFFVVSGLLVQWLYALLECIPFNLNWAPAVSACSYSRKYFAATWSFHVFSDLLVYAIPFFIIFQLQTLNRNQKIGALAMFAVGFINLGCATAILTINLMPTQSATTLGAYNFLYTLQQGTAIMVVCMPQIRLLVTKRYSYSARKRANSVSNIYGSGTREPSRSRDPSRSRMSKRENSHSRSISRTVDFGPLDLSGAAKEGNAAGGEDGWTIDFETIPRSPVQLTLVRNPFDSSGKLETRVITSDNSGSS